MSDFEDLLIEETGLVGAGSLSPDQVAAYHRDGFLFPLRAMPGEKAAGYLAKLDAFEREYPIEAGRILRSKSYLALPWANELIRLPRVLDAVESMIGPNIYCWSMSFFIKDAHSTGIVAWHQDAPLGGTSVFGRVMTAWVALAPSIIENGCMQVVKGSHSHLLEHRAGPGSNLLVNSQEIMAHVEPGSETPITLQPGEFSFHHDLIVHGSNRNDSDLRRVGIAIRYTTPFEREDGNVNGETATLVRGVDPFGTFEQEGVPAREMDPEALAYREEVVRRLRKAKGIAGY